MSGTLGDGRWELVDPLGEGTMGRVWRALDRWNDHWVAIKVLSPAMARHEQVRERFRREADVLRRLKHERVVALHELRDADEGLFIVMDLAPGGSLLGWLRRHGAMPPRMAVGCALQAAEGLGFAHGLGIVHRDVKPQNLLIRPDGVAVADFGIARLEEAAISLTRTGVRMGSIGYMAPEQARDAKAADHRADVFGLGATLFTLLTGIAPGLIGDDLRRHGDALPDAVARVVMRSTLDEPDHRYASMERLARRLEAALDELPPDPPSEPLFTPASDDELRGEPSSGPTLVLDD